MAYHPFTIYNLSTITTAVINYIDFYENPGIQHSSDLSVFGKTAGNTDSSSQIRLQKPDGREIVSYISLNPLDETLMNLTFDQDTVPANTLISDYYNVYNRGTIDAIINPLTFNPQSVEGENVDRRYLILEDVIINQQSIDGPDGWKGRVGETMAHANDIIQWDGVRWWVIFDSANVTETTYITNAYTGIQYKWDGIQWTKSFEGVYTNEKWRLML